MLRRAFPTHKRPDGEVVLDCTSFIFSSVIFLHLLVCMAPPAALRLHELPRRALPFESPADRLHRRLSRTDNLNHFKGFWRKSG